MTTHLADPLPQLVGRSSSSFTRVTRVFAAELQVEYELHVVRDLMSLQRADYGENPALKLPSLRAGNGVWFGALNSCRALSRMSVRDLRIVWPELLSEPLLANAQELTVQAMATEVALIMAGLNEAERPGAHQVKMRTSLINTLGWLDARVSAILAALPVDRELSYLEVTLFCLCSHLEFRDVLPLTGYPALTEFCRTFADRPCAQQTAYRFDL